METKAKGVVAHRESTQNVTEEAHDEPTINLWFYSESHIYEPQRDLS